MTTADTMMIRAELLGALRASNRAMSTSELARMMPWRCDRLAIPCALLCDAPPHSRKLRVLECHRDWHVVAVPRTAQDGPTGVYRHLVSMARAQVIQRIRVSPRVVHWQVVAS
ncbi:MAG TPA: hypothetical protein PLH92_14315 [Mycobacterium sp.]|jgi:hypothetical protein|uniref:hypothetical protein n=1 Tax=Mycolicibacterium sp. TaxID=2320850 RepID=UPI001DA1D302|nr:hypothetical protein [Mycolicibacterium sp.]MCB1289766.1 hypothetical protein [Mycobacterium sp.]HNM85236.1 hypothetical protein [Mycobacterium sp.]HPX38509.1 hypothetical protein [Mycobacterium sp.]HQC77880.1 hypothetical protein [Mycobacterium sp.]